jgi:hypothetical protein
MMSVLVASGGAALLFAAFGLVARTRPGDADAGCACLGGRESCGACPHRSEGGLTRD